MGLRFTGFGGGDGTGCGCVSDCGGTCSATVCVVPTCGVSVAGATVTVKSVGGTTIGTGSLTGGCFTVAIPGPGAYIVQVTATGYKDYSSTQTLACGGRITVAPIPSDGGATVLFTVFGCCALPLPGATVTLDGVSQTTDSSGHATFSVDAASILDATWTASKSRFATATGDLRHATVLPGLGGPCSQSLSQLVAMVPDDGHACGPGLVDPLPKTLSLTDSALGIGASLRYSSPIPSDLNGLASGLGSLSGWWGEQTIAWPFTAAVNAVCGFAACPSTTITVQYFLRNCSAGSLPFEQPLAVFWTMRICGACFGASFSVHCGGVPSDPPPICHIGDTTTPIVDFRRGSFAALAAGPGDPHTTYSQATTIPYHATLVFGPNSVPGGSVSWGQLYTDSGSTITVTE